MKEQLEETPEKYPLLIRAYGIVSIVAGAIQVVSFILSLISAFFGDLNLSSFENHAVVTIVIGIIALILSFVLSAMFVVLGIRLLLGLRHRVAFTANLMIVLETLELLCQFMLFGLSHELIPTAINIVILIVLEAYSDPGLRQERALQRHLHELEWKSEAEEGTLGLDQSGKGYMSLNFFNLFWVFVICCFLGLVVEEIYHMIVVDPGVYQDRAGLLYGPFSPIYGFGAVLMTIALNRFHDKNPIMIFLVSAVIGGAFEFFVSWFLEIAFGITAWDYTGTFLSIGGRTNGMFMCMWGALGLLWVKFGVPVLLKIVNKIPWNWRYVVTGVSFALMVADCILTLAALDCWYQRQSNTMDYDNCSAIVAFCNDEYDNEFMDNRFQSMSMDTNKSARSN